MNSYFSRIAGDITELRAAFSVPDTSGARGLRRLHNRIMGALRHLAREHVTPSQVFLAIVVGMMVGTTPLIGLHLIICIIAAMTLRLNKFIVYLAANISIPPMIPFLAFLSIQGAYFVAHGDFMVMDYETLYHHRFSFILYWMAGALPVGALLGVVSGAIVVAVMSARKDGAGDPESLQFKKLANELHRAFLPSGKVAAGIARSKSTSDPVYRMVVEQAAGARRLLDIGGGQGLLSLLVALRHRIPALVVDYDERKLTQGQMAASALGLAQAERISFENFDVFKQEKFPDCDLITCIDVLHYQPVEEQRVLVERIVRALPAGGRLIIRDMDADFTWRTRWTVLQERFSLLFSLTIANGVYPRSGRDLVSQLQRLGFSVAVRRAWSRTPFSNTLFVARKD